MASLEDIDARDGTGGTPRMRRLRQISPETGRFLALLAACAPPGRWLEIGTSAGYSALWLALACRAAGRHLVTFEVLGEKATLARETFRVAGVEDMVSLVHDDARRHLQDYPGVAFCCLDAEQEVYGDCYEAVVPNLVPGGLRVADTAINHREALAPMLDRALADPRVDAMVVSVGKGELVCRRG